MDRHWNLIAANRAITPFLAGVDPSLAHPAINVLRITFHPDGIAPRIANLGQWRTQTLERVNRQIDRTGDPVLIQLYNELAGYPAPTTASGGYEESDRLAGLATELHLNTEHGTLHLLYTTTLFGSPRDVTLSEIAIESFFPADAATAALLRAMPASPGHQP